MRLLLSPLVLCVLLAVLGLALSTGGAVEGLAREEMMSRDGRESSRRAEPRELSKRRSSKNNERSHKFDHYYGKPLKVVCNTRRGEAMYRVESEQRGGNFDRIWKWGCRRVLDTSLTECQWTDDEINDWNGPISYMCPMNQVMTGVASKHTAAKEDRRWKVQCCHARGYHTESCTLTKFLNKRGKEFMYHTKSNCRTARVFTGFVTSDYKPHDREWKILECSLACDNQSRSVPSRPVFPRRHYYLNRH